MGRITGWAAGAQYKLRTADGVLSTEGGDAANPEELDDSKTIIQVDATAAVAVFALPDPSSRNLDGPITFVRAAGANTIQVGSNDFVGGVTPVELNGAVGSAVSFISNGTDAWIVVSLNEL